MVMELTVHKHFSAERLTPYTRTHGKHARASEPPRLPEFHAQQSPRPRAAGWPRPHCGEPLPTPSRPTLLQGEAPRVSAGGALGSPGRSSRCTST